MLAPHTNLACILLLNSNTICVVRHLLCNTNPTSLHLYDCQCAKCGCTKAEHDAKKKERLAEKGKIEQYWKEELQTSAARPWRRAKVMFVGEGRAGKTSALESLLGMPFRRTESTVGTEMFDVSVETAVRWSKQDSNVPEHYRVAARWAAWRSKHKGMKPPGVETTRNNQDNPGNTRQIAASKVSAAPAVPAGIRHLNLRFPKLLAFNTQSLSLRYRQEGQC